MYPPKCPYRNAIWCSLCIEWHPIIKGKETICKHFPIKERVMEKHKMVNRERDIVEHDIGWRNCFTYGCNNEAMGEFSNCENCFNGGSPDIEALANAAING